MQLLKSVFVPILSKFNKEDYLFVSYNDLVDTDKVSSLMLS